MAKLKWSEGALATTPTTLALGLLAIGWLVACGQPVATEPETEAPHGSIELFEETLALEDGGTLAYERGIATLPLRRDQSDSSNIQVEFYRFRRDADVKNDAPPIVLLHGGPGYAGLGPRLADLGYFEARLSRYTRIADVIVPGQRGFGSSHATPCDPMRKLSIEEAMDTDARGVAIREATANCRAKWQAEGLDLTGFDVPAASADVADIVRHLGYERIQLRGVSFGSHWGIAVLRDHPQLVERAILAGLEGPDHTYDMPSGVLAALERIAAAAEASPELTGRIPQGGILEAYRRLIATAEEAPISVDLVDPETDQPITVQLDGDDLRQVFSGLRHFTQFRFRAPRWPLALLEIVEGNLEKAADIHVWNLLDTELDDAAWFQYDCASGMSPARREQMRLDPAVEIMGRTWERLDALCEGWTADLGEDFRGSFSTSVPTVLVQGNWDTATPYENALELRPSFENHHFVHVEGGSHGAIREAIEEVPGFRQAMDQWLATGEFEQIPSSVSLPPVQWSSGSD